MRYKGFTALVAFVCLTACGTDVRSGGLSTQLGEAVVENLRPGATYSLKDLANLNLMVTNTSNHRVNLRMEVLQPGPTELRFGAEPIPDIGWVNLDRDYYPLAPAETAATDMKLSIPGDVAYLGKTYQFAIWSHTVGSSDAGMCLAYGLKSRIIFTTDSVMAQADQVHVRQSSNLCFNVAPHEIHLSDVEPGSVYDVWERRGIRLTLTNQSDKEREYLLSSKRVSDSRAVLADGYEDTPDASILKFDVSSITLPAGCARDVNMTLHFPADPEYSGKKFQFIVYACGTTGEVTSGVYSRLFACTQQTTGAYESNNE